MAIINADEADLLDVSLDAPEAVDLSVHYQMLKMLKEHYGATVEKAVLWGKEDQVPQTSVYMRKADGTVVELTVKLADALVLATLGEAPFYIRTEMLENRVPDFAKKSVSHLQAALLRGLPMFYLEKEMEKAIREENYEYAELIKREMQARRERGETDDSLEEEANEKE
jgi:bifunctional DNase/RNase